MPTEDLSEEDLNDLLQILEELEKLQPDGEMASVFETGSVDDFAKLLESVDSRGALVERLNADFEGYLEVTPAHKTDSDFKKYLQREKGWT